MPALAQTYTMRVISVVDGDTVEVSDGARKATVRLADIDAPEKAQPHGAASRDALAALVLNQMVLVKPRVSDDYGRVVATIHVNGVNVNEAQLRNGMAWEYSQHHANRSLKALETEARGAKRGLWASARPLPPWEFRKSGAGTAQAHAEQRAQQRAPVTRTCGNKQHCSQMISCAEARFYFTQCGVKTLDKNADGVPCEKLCAAGR